MKKLFKIELEYTVMVLAEDIHEAKQIAMDNVDDGTPDECHGFVIENKKDMPREWADCYPFGGDCDKTCEELIEK